MEGDRIVLGGRVKISQAALFAQTFRMVLRMLPLPWPAQYTPPPPMEQNHKDSSLFGQTDHMDRQTKSFRDKRRSKRFCLSVLKMVYVYLALLH